MSHQDCSSARRAGWADSRDQSSDAVEQTRKGSQRMPGARCAPPGTAHRRVPWEITRVRARGRTRTDAGRPRTELTRSHLLGGDLLEQSGLDLAAGAERAHAGGERRGAGGAAQSGEHRERPRPKSRGTSPKGIERLCRWLRTGPEDAKRAPQTPTRIPLSAPAGARRAGPSRHRRSRPRRAHARTSDTTSAKACSSTPRASTQSLRHVSPLTSPGARWFYPIGRRSVADAPP